MVRKFFYFFQKVQKTYPGKRGSESFFPGGK
jgi:hypothetical protein